MTSSRAHHAAMLLPSTLIGGMLLLCEISPLPAQSSPDAWPFDSDNQNSQQPQKTAVQKQIEALYKRDGRPLPDYMKDDASDTLDANPQPQQPAPGNNRLQMAPPTKQAPINQAPAGPAPAPASSGRPGSIQQQLSDYYQSQGKTMPRPQWATGNSTAYRPAAAGDATVQTAPPQAPPKPRLIDRLNPFRYWSKQSSANGSADSSTTPAQPSAVSQNLRPPADPSPMTPAPATNAPVYSGAGRAMVWGPPSASQTAPTTTNIQRPVNGTISAELGAPQQFGQPPAPSFGQSTASPITQTPALTFGQPTSPTFGQPASPPFVPSAATANVQLPSLSSGLPVSTPVAQPISSAAAPATPPVAAPLGPIPPAPADVVTVNPQSPAEPKTPAPAGLASPVPAGPLAKPTENSEDSPNPFKDLSESEADKNGTPYTGLTLDDEQSPKSGSAGSKVSTADVKQPAVGRQASPIGSQTAQPAKTPDQQSNPSTASRTAELVKTTQSQRSSDTTASQTSVSPPSHDASAPPKAFSQPTHATAMPQHQRGLNTAAKMRKIGERVGQRGLKGFCPVALRDQRDLADGKAYFSSTFESKTYYFSSAEAKARFDANPEKYAPVAGGIDVVVKANSDRSIDGTLDFAAWYRDRLYLFSSPESLEAFALSPRPYAAPYQNVQ